MGQNKPRCVLLAFIAVAFLAQSTGAADLALMFGPAARPAAFPPALLTTALARQPASGPAEPLLRRFRRALRSFRDDGAVVAAWAEERWFSPPDESAAARRIFAVRPETAPTLPPETGPAYAPGTGELHAGAAAPADRMLLLSVPEFVAVANGNERASAGFVRRVYQERFEERWWREGGLRYRLAYLRPIGMSWGDAEGFHFAFPGEGTRSWLVALPRQLLRSFPIYNVGDAVEAEVEIENAGAETLANLRVFIGQEAYNGKRGVGKRAGGMAVTEIGELAPGRKTVLRYRFVVANREGEKRPVFFDQTHLTVVRALSGGSEATLVDNTEAGIIDPP